MPDEPDPTVSTAMVGELIAELFRRSNGCIVGFSPEVSSPDDNYEFILAHTDDALVNAGLHRVLGEKLQISRVSRYYSEGGEDDEAGA